MSSKDIPNKQWDDLYNTWLAVHPEITDIEHAQDQFQADFDKGWRPSHMSRKDPGYKLLMKDEDTTIEAGLYNKNRRYEVEAGTKYIQVTKKFCLRQSPITVCEAALDEAWNAAEREYGKFDHDQVDFTVTILTMQVLIEFRIQQC